MARTSALTKDIPKLKENQVVQCRGGIWRVLGEDKGFWELELIKQGANFSESLVRVWAIPSLEAETLKVVDPKEALAPYPVLDQKRNGKLLSATIQAKKNQCIDVQKGSDEPSVALHCAIEAKDWQFEPWRRIVNALPFPRLLIADDVGLGKTTEAAIILAELTRRRRADRSLIICPQHLCEKWQTELFERFGMIFEIFDRGTRERLSDRGIRNPWEIMERVIVSRDFVKRWENLKPLKNVSWDMVVIDECHHFVRDGARGATLLRDLAEGIVYKSPGLLLLSATPFTGKKEEFHSLLKLIDPKFQDEGSAGHWDPKSPYLIRRLKKDVKAYGETIQDRVIEHVVVAEGDMGAQERKVLSRVQKELENQKANPNMNSWDHLVFEMAKKRLSSSWAAFYETAKGETTLNSWIGEKTIKDIADLVEKFESAKLEKLANLLKRIFKENPLNKVVVFTESVDTQLFIAKYLRSSHFSEKEIATIEGQTAKHERLQIEDDFANRNSKLRILVATDTISEGKDLQHACCHLIHFELPWSLVKIEQRNGRIDRLGQTQKSKIYNIVLDTPATPDQKIMQRLTQKILFAEERLGSVSPVLESFDLNLAEIDDADKEIKRQEKEIERQTAEYANFWGEISSSPLSPAPQSNVEDFSARRAMLDVMITQLGGGLEAHGKAKDEYLLHLPDGWDLPEFLFHLGYPSKDKPWRITFNPQIFLAHEKHLLSGGASDRHLHFISPIHPMSIQIEQRFRAHAAKGAYPIFKVSGVPYDHLVVAELSVRSKSGRIVAQKMEVIDFKTRKPLSAALLEDIKATTGEMRLPQLKSWQNLHSDLETLAKTFAQDLDADFSQKRSMYLKEQNSIKDKTLPGVQERSQWLSELWSVDVEQSHYQIAALLISE